MSDSEDDIEDQDDPSEGYAWGFARQERELPADQYRLHLHLLDEIDEEEIESFDLEDADDYTLWAAAQAFEELERDVEAIALLKRIAASTSAHPALDYPAILLHLAERQKDRGDYDEAMAALNRAEEIDSGRRSEYDESRAEILVLRGRDEEGLARFEEIARAFPEDPWVPLRAAWALLSAGHYDRIEPWIDRCERALRGVTDEEEARSAASEIDRLRRETEARLRRHEQRGAPPRGGPLGVLLVSLQEEILADLDAEEARLTADPPRSAEARARALERLSALHQRASHAWDDAVEARDDALIAELDEVRWGIVGVAERFGISLPDAD